jgi:hypothetical protein
MSGSLARHFAVTVPYCAVIVASFFFGAFSHNKPSYLRCKQESACAHDPPPAPLVIILTGVSLFRSLDVSLYRVKDNVIWGRGIRSP